MCRETVCGKTKIPALKTPLSYGPELEVTSQKLSFLEPFLCCLSSVSWIRSTVPPFSCWVPKGCPVWTTCRGSHAPAGGWVSTMGSTTALERGRRGRNEVRLESLWAGCPGVKVRIPKRQFSACRSGNALWSLSSGLEMPPPQYSRLGIGALCLCFPSPV